VSPDVQANYLASPPLVVAHALAGTVTKDLTKEPLGEDKDGKPVYLRDIWPTSAEIQEFVEQNVTRDLFARKYADVFKGDEYWQKVQAPEGQTYAWDDGSTYVQNPPYFDGMKKTVWPRLRHQGRTHPRPVRRQDHHRSHFPGRFDQGGVARRQIPHRQWRRRRRLQPVRHAPRQS
jgi:aconitase A